MKHEWQEGDLFIVTKFPPLVIVGCVKRVAPMLTGAALQADCIRYNGGHMVNASLNEYYNVDDCQPLAPTGEDEHHWHDIAKQEVTAVTEFPSPLTSGEPEAALAAANATDEPKHFVRESFPEEYGSF